MDSKSMTPLLTTIIIGVFIVGLIFAGMGIWLVILGATGDADFSFFGQTMKTTNVGIAAILIGATTIILLLRRTLGTIDNVVNHQTPDRNKENAKTPSNDWTNTKTPQALIRALGDLSDTQREIIRLLSPTFSGVIGGLPQHDIAEQIQLPEREVHYRLLELEHLQLVETSRRTYELYYKLPYDVETLIDKDESIQKLLKSRENSPVK